MSSNIQEGPNLAMNVRYSKGAREDSRQREESLVEILDNVDTFHVSKQDGEHLPASKRTHFRAAAAALGLLFVLILARVVFHSRVYISLTLEKEQLQNRIEELQASNDILRNNDCWDKNNHTAWMKFGCSCYYKSAEMKNWTESRRDCKARGADLVVIGSHNEKDFISKLSKPETTWIGLQAVKKKADWADKWKWNPVDQSPLTYGAWKNGVEVNPVHRALSTAYVDLEGTWTQTNNGSKRWICEKQISRV
ncbi:CD209 antigen-like protein A [Eleginops maclovinus]|uniref:CD209 antigen-like protein A n=1 Tax=Eleginops maclovinus TaxID=56733 RepID=UPI003080A9C6